MGKGIRTAHKQVWKGNASEKETRRTKCANAQASTGKGRSRKEYDLEKR